MPPSRSLPLPLFRFFRSLRMREFTEVRITAAHKTPIRTTMAREIAANILARRDFTTLGGRRRGDEYLPLITISRGRRRYKLRGQLKIMPRLRDNCWPHI